MKTTSMPVILILFALVVGGCAPLITTGKNFDLTQVPRIQDKVTTKEEILSMLGQPYNKTITGDIEMWMYMYSETNRRRTFKESFARDFGLSVAMPSPKMQSLSITFKGNVVESHSLSVSGDK